MNFIHRFIPGSAAPTLLLLHGTGGSEDDLLGLGRDLLPGAGLLSPRGKILENGLPRFFRRLAEGVFDEPDLIHRTHELADFVAAAALEYKFDPKRLFAVGYSNGANIAASLLLLRPETLAGTVLLRAMTPLVPATLPTLAGIPVLIASGRSDAMIPAASAEQLAGLLRSAGASVTHRWAPSGHGLTAPEIEDAHRWLTSEAK